MNDTTVRFVEAESGFLSLLEIETPRRRTVFQRVVEALFALRLQIVRAESRETGPRRVERLWLVEFDGAPIRAGRRLAVQVEILRAVGIPTRSYLTGGRSATP